MVAAKRGTEGEGGRLVGGEGLPHGEVEESKVEESRGGPWWHGLEDECSYLYVRVDRCLASRRRFEKDRPWEGQWCSTCCRRPPS